MTRWVILALVAISALPSLCDAWFSAPLDRFGPLFFALWLAALYAASDGENRSTFYWLLSALLSLSLSVVTHLNVLAHLALVLAGVSTVRCSARVPLSLAAVSWLPVLSWLLKDLPYGAIQGLKSGVCFSGLLLGWRVSRE